MKSYTDIGQSKKLAEILPIESADMTLPFRHTQKDEYIPEHVGTRNYINVYNEMLALPGMDREQVCKLIQPCWSLAALLKYLKEIKPQVYSPVLFPYDGKWLLQFVEYGHGNLCETTCDNPVDVCYKLILKLNEQKLL